MQAVYTQSCVHFLWPPVWVPTRSAHPTVPSRFSYHVPCGGWTRSSATSAGSPAHPTAPGSAPVLRDSPRLPWTRISQTQGSQLPSGQVAPQFPGVRCAEGCSAGGVVRESLRSPDHGGSACLRSAVLPEPSHSLKPPRSARDFCRVCEVPAACPSPASSLPTSPKAKEGGNSFHNKSPAPGLGGQSRLEQGPRC